MQTPLFLYCFPALPHNKLECLKFAKLLAVSLVNNTTLFSFWGMNPGILHRMNTDMHESYGHFLKINFTTSSCSKPGINECRQRFFGSLLKENCSWRMIHSTACVWSLNLPLKKSY